MFIEEKLCWAKQEKVEQETLRQVAQNFTATVHNKHEDFNSVMREFEIFQNYVNSMEELNDILVN